MQSSSVSVFNEFAHNIGININAQTRQDFLHLLYDDEAELHVQYTDNNELFVVVRRPVPAYKLSSALRLALRLCHWDEHVRFPVQASCKSGRGEHWLVFAVCLNFELLALTELQQTVALLRHFDQRIVELVR